MLEQKFPKLLISFTAVLFLYACAKSTVVSDEAQKCEVTPPSEPIACTMQYDPVCGCNGKTYGNACSAVGAGVSHSTPGACDDKADNR